MRNATVSPDLAPQAIPATTGAVEALRRTRPWVLFIGIMSIVGAAFAALYLLAGIVMAAATAGAGYRAAGTMPAGWMPTMMIGYGAVDAVAMTLASVWLLRYAGAIRALVQMPESAQASLDRAVVSQRKLWTLLGVLAVAGLVAGLALVTVFAVIGMHAPAPAGLHT